jgi:D-xylose transport system substrate-binding protein
MTVYKPIEVLAKRAAELSIQLARGEKPEVDSGISDGSFLVPYYRIAPSLVDRENIDDYIIGSGFHRAEDVYRNVTGKVSKVEPGKN